ncbi:MAG: hypothetical protein Q7S86_02710 [bacterium]|nr:hypothetical protein [bacterium]
MKIFTVLALLALAIPNFAQPRPMPPTTTLDDKAMVGTPTVSPTPPPPNSRPGVHVETPGVWGTPVDWTQFTSRLGKIKYAVDQVREIVMIVDVPNSLGGRQVVRIAYTNAVPTFESMVTLAEAQILKFEVTSEKSLHVTVKFRDGSFYDGPNESDTQQDKGVLFSGSVYVMPAYDAFDVFHAEAKIDMRLNSVLPVKIAGLRSARLVTYSGADGIGFSAYSQVLETRGDQLMLPTYGNGIQEIIYNVWDTHGTRSLTLAYSLVTGSKVQIHQLLVRALVSTPDVLSFKNKKLVEVVIEKWRGYGVIPLVELIYDETGKIEISISAVETDDGKDEPLAVLQARGFWIQRIQSAEEFQIRGKQPRLYVTILPGEKSVIYQVSLPGVYRVEPDIDVNEGGVGPPPFIPPTPHN